MTLSQPHSVYHIEVDCNKRCRLELQPEKRAKTEISFAQLANAPIAVEVGTATFYVDSAAFESRRRQRRRVLAALELRALVSDCLSICADPSGRCRTNRPSPPQPFSIGTACSGTCATSWRPRPGFWSYLGSPFCFSSTSRHFRRSISIIWRRLNTCWYALPYSHAPLGGSSRARNRPRWRLIEARR